MSKHAYRLILLDFLLLVFIGIFMLVIYPNHIFEMNTTGVCLQILLAAVCLFSVRISAGLYTLVWRYVKTREFLRLMLSDFAAGVIYYILQWVLPMQKVTFIRAVVMLCINLLAAIALRLLYQYLYESRSQESRIAAFVRRMTALITGIRIEPRGSAGKINIAIIGAGRVGAGLAEELIGNPAASYLPCFFVDTDPEKIGRNINGIPVLSEAAVTRTKLDEYPIQEVVIALPDADAELKRQMYQHYRELGCRVKTYDIPTAQNADGKLSMREFDPEELLFRRQQHILDDRTKNYYRGKTVLITGGGGSIGSELARQIARMEPKKLIILDVYENGAYDIQQELKLSCPDLDLAVEIITITDREELKAVFLKHMPDVVLHAAAHKHVPLMETNCCEAVKNNVFGTKNILETAEETGVQKFIMISTDKAVNPTNVMGATKRMCEMLVLGHQGKMECSATRFGNVLGSNGSVIPLFKRQIQNGGPITITDKRIIRYFMTIPEASQLVLISGAMASHGELYVLDMGKPVKILDLAENIIRLSGVPDIKIVETGLRPGEKLYEELLIKSEELDRTDNEKIYIERDKPVDAETLTRSLELLEEAVETADDEACRNALKKTVPTFRDSDEINRKAVTETPEAQDR